MSAEFEVRRLRQRDRADSFQAGPSYEKLDAYIRRYAKQNEKRKQTATHVAVVGADRVIGYATTVPGTVAPERLKDAVKGLSGYPAPVLVLARLAVDMEFRALKVGPRLLREAVLLRAVTLAEDYGCVGVYVDAKPPPPGEIRGSADFYRKYQFVEIPAPPPHPDHPAPATTPMFLPLETVRALVTPAAMP
jgi:predicted N-acetyltransferase YhbS